MRGAREVQGAREEKSAKKITPVCKLLFKLLWHSSMNAATQLVAYASRDPRLFFK